MNPLFSGLKGLDRFCTGGLEGGGGLNKYERGWYGWSNAVIGTLGIHIRSCLLTPLMCSIPAVPEVMR